MNNKCLDCNKSIDKRAKRCMSCAVKNIWKDRPKKEIRKYKCESKFFSRLSQFRVQKHCISGKQRTK